jgi:creatinine amidohydrolase
MRQDNDVPAHKDIKTALRILGERGTLGQMSASTQYVRLGDMTAAAFAAATQKSPVILLPLGSHEDHGPHQPMGDYLLADMMAERIALRATEQGVPTFVAPSLPFGVADYFGSSLGGLALSPETFRRVLLDVLEGLLRHGLRKIIILNAHGGNVPVVHEVTLGIRREKGLIIPSFYLWKIARQLMEARIGVAHGRFGHGAEPLLALNLALRPDCTAGVAPAAVTPASVLGLPVAGFGALDFRGLTIEAPVEFGEIAGDAIATSWQKRDAALGEEIAEALVSAGAGFVAHFSGESN